MFPLFGKSSKSPTEVVKALRESLNTLEKGGDQKKEEKAQEEVRYHDEILLHLFLEWPTPTFASHTLTTLAALAT